ncbi:putative mitochondrial adenine nucleotide transporter BTL3 [Wolffia australiana]
MTELEKYFPSLAGGGGGAPAAETFLPGGLFRPAFFASSRLSSAILPPETKDKEKDKPPRRSTWTDMPKFLLAGAVSTMISRTCVAPLERVKLECIIRGPGQTLTGTVRWIWEAEGARGFWKGNVLNLVRMIPFKSISFVCYDMYCDCLLHSPGKKEITNHDRLVAGGISGVAATIVCLPLDTIRTRLMAPGGEALGGVEGCFFHMVRKEGFGSLYKGLAPALISMGPSSAIFYAVYDMLKAMEMARRRRRGREGGGAAVELGVAKTLIYGAVAGACAETVTYPLEVLRRQLQLQQNAGLGMASAFVRLVERDGVASLFAGIIPSALQVLPSAALSYLFYEMVKSILKIN